MRNWLYLIPALFVPISAARAQSEASVLPPLSKPQEELIEICQEMNKAFGAFYTRIEEITDEAARERYAAQNDPSAKCVERLMAFERAHHGTHAGLMAARRLVLLGAGGGEYDNPRDLGRRWALSILPAYADAPELPEILRYLDGGNQEPAAEPLLRQVATAPHVREQNREFARYMLAAWALAMRNGRAFAEQRLSELAEGSPVRYPKEKEYLSTSLASGLSPERLAELERESLEALAALAQSDSGARQPAVAGVDDRWHIIRFDAVKTRQMPLVRELAAGLLFKERHLRVGRPAPALELPLVSGDPWSLAEQRGKAVVIQFSFKGCGPCEAMYEDLRNLAETYRGKLAILTIMADEHREDAVAAVNSGKMTWDVHWDGAKGPIATQWGVTSFPTVYVIGPDGQVAAYGLRGELLKTRIATLTTPP